MARVPTKLFELEVAPLLPEEVRGISGQDIAEQLVGLLDSKQLKQLAKREGIMPVGLRWRLQPLLGLPRVPFRVWRRSLKTKIPFDVQFKSGDIPGLQLSSGVFTLPQAPYYILAITINNTSGSSIKVEALDMVHEPLFLQSVHVSPGLSTIHFKHPFIGGFSCKNGNFQITGMAGVTMTHYANLDDWELIEIVGLPTVDGEVNGYNSELQGLPNQLLAPLDAAMNRIAIAQQFYQPLDTSLPTGENLPTWEIPSPKQALNELREGDPSLIGRINDLFLAVDNQEVALQADFHTKLIGQGIRQPEFPDQVTSEVTFDLPFLASFLLNSAIDPWFALSSGFGTTDFPQFRSLSSKFATSSKSHIPAYQYFQLSHDYMVSSKFLSRFFGLFKMEQEYCALSHPSVAAPLVVRDLSSRIYSQNRPAERDGLFTAEVALEWQKLNRLQIQGYAIGVVENNNNNGTYLNEFRSPESTLPALFAPTKPVGNSDSELQGLNRFMDHQAPIPFTGQQQARYGVAAMDAFARWSAWKTVQQTKSPPLPEAPRLMALTFEPDLSGIVDNRVPHTLTFEVAWDWQDRSPKRIQLAGVYHRRQYFTDGTKDDGHIPPDSYPTVFQKQNLDTTGNLLELIFPSDNPPGTPPDFEVEPNLSDLQAVVELLPQAVNSQGQISEGELRRYRVTIPNLELTFDPSEEWFYTLFVKGTEWRNPTVLSDSTLPLLPGRPPRLTTFIPNPIPPPPPEFIPATVLWSALPDARGMARYRLSFKSVFGAGGGYVIYQAFETKLRDIVGLPFRSDPDLIGRANELRDIVMPDVRNLDAFSRVNTELIPPLPPGSDVEYEVEIPGTLDGLVAFAVASVSKEQETSPLSTPWLVVAVPRRSVPAAPMLSVLQQNGVSTLSCQFPKNPFQPSRVELKRVRREYPSRSIDTMGQALHISQENEWEALNSQGKMVNAEDTAATFRFSFSESTAPSWFPYYYRAIAIGQSDARLGLVAGRSSQSNLITIEKLPRSLPVMDNVSADYENSKSIRLQFTSDATIERTPHGNFQLEVLAWDFIQKVFAPNPILDISLQEAIPYPEKENLLVRDTLYYTELAPNGQRKFTMLLKMKRDEFLFRLCLKDPLSRNTFRTVSGKATTSEPPDLSNLNVTKRGSTVLVFFESSNPVTLPSFGAYTLEITMTRSFGRGTDLLLKINLDQIEVGDFRGLRIQRQMTILREEKKAGDTRHKYGVSLPINTLSLLFNQVVLKVRLTNPAGVSRMLERRIR